MITGSLLKQLPKAVSIMRNARMSDYTTFRLGGTCPLLIDCPNKNALAETIWHLVPADVEFIVIGQGSNLLVADEGLDKVVLRFCAEENPVVEFKDNHVHVAGNTLLDDLVNISIKNGLGDLSFCSGIPGTVAGAIVGNAGAMGRQIGDVVESVELLEPDGNRCVLSGSDLKFEYRSSILKTTGDILLTARLALEPMDVDKLKIGRAKIMDLRHTRHPDWKAMPCAGSVFRNVEPTSAAERRQAAGWFLERAGAKDFRVGGARLFERHANIIIAEPEATARDVFELSEKMADAVRDKFDFDLVREIKLLGQFNG